MDTSRGIIAALLIGALAFGIDHLLVGQSLFTPGASTLALVLGALAAIVVSDVEIGGSLPPPTPASVALASLSVQGGNAASAVL